MRTITLPKQVTTDSIRKNIIEFRNYVDKSSDSASVSIDLTKVEFIQPAGVIALNNIFQWSKQHKGIEMSFVVDTETENRRNWEVMEYLSDCGFFTNFGQADIFKVPKLRPTMLSLKAIETSKVNQWKQSDLMGWLQKQTGKRNDFSSICVAIDEIFNNISDHSTEKIGSIFGQYYPKNNEIIIAVSDFGIGIPTSLKEKCDEEKNDNEWIEEALKEGVSTQSVPQNRGAGLANIMKTLTTNKIGQVTIISNCGKVRLEDNQIVESRSFVESYQGTFFELKIDTSNQSLYDLEEEEEFEW
ncbi:ATP-binding protein [Streptococcus ferus]|uniref:ATP-binding region, ATPase family protein n=1 Tax=Streptococcus ferus TaxID=1345 RepID=A0A2X3VND2_9STRE|nr:ATP-binding protein [Streptococcus ferus]SQF40918.1 ATP-binding region, ATPase family protein [Streptococcus ferus]